MKQYIKKNNHWNYDTIYSEILKIKPKNLADWENQSGGSYGAALKLGRQRELYEKYCHMGWQKSTIWEKGQNSGRCCQNLANTSTKNDWLVASPQ